MTCEPCDSHRLVGNACAGQICCNFAQIDAHVGSFPREVAEKFSVEYAEGGSR